MDRLTIDWRRGDGERAYVVLVRDGVRQEMMLTREEIRALDVDYKRTRVRIRLPIPPELAELARRSKRRRRRPAKDERLTLIHAARAVVAAWRAPVEPTPDGASAHVRRLADALANLERACLEWQRGDLAAPEELEAARQRWRDESDDVA